MKRLFIAIKIVPEGDLLRMISSVKAMVGDESIKWVDPCNVHITLAFLGDTGERKIKPLTRILPEVCTGHGRFEFSLSGTGVFKNYNDPRVIWVGINPKEAITALNAKITCGLKSGGFLTEDRSFRPHLTIGRIRTIKDSERLKRVLETYRETEFQTIKASEVILYESILMQTGPLYKELAKFPL
ncbi:MAG: RNA 2',3'-cyclic phosphodiesterase [Bacteroidales bacterium]|jgi:2'-5' RNA ligase|nr:RNA 2',3'-cyclic phosphodiesterase [Bacteroidales bacterium]HOW10785.1 RNA 2',3'-cyclic phosphodiesterase [Bacteroidales bacterium]